MKIGIYNKYLNTMGGGEKHMGVMAAHLSKTHDVTLVTHEPVDLKNLNKRFAIDLSKCKVEYIPEMPDEEMGYHFKKYDLFINSTIFSQIPNMAKRGALLIFFPKYRNNIYPIWFKKFLLHSLGILFKDSHSTIKKLHGFYPEENYQKHFGNWTHKNIEIDITKPAKRVIISYIPFKQNDILEVKSVDEFTIQREVGQITLNFIVRKPHNIKLVSSTEVKEAVPEANDQVIRELGVFIHNIETDRDSLITRLIKQFSKVYLLRRIFNFVKKKWSDQINFFTDETYLETYDTIIANSDYTKGWIKKLLKKDSVVLPPPIDTEIFKSKAKRKIILSVGRFFVGSHNKKQLDMIRMFKNMYDKYPEAKDWEYHLAGGTHVEKIHQDYLKKCYSEAEGYPIHLHPDIKFEDLKELYTTASMFWHAAGYKEDIDKNPDRFEHFGMTTVESMSGGTVPVVIGMAGQKETVKDGYSGFLWNTEEECIEKTVKLMQDSELLAKLSKNAIAASQQYSFKEFYKTVDKIFKPLLKK